jgi:para-aminobenzoate synthetase/4-amino-4-deoxychorismate lyase
MLFFAQSNGMVTCKPMKGTAPLGATAAETQANAEALKSSEKNRAENLMVVDMIRNDLGRVAEVGTVRTPALFDVEQLSTVLQMTSTVQAKFGGSVREIFDALFPCASIVGAPKVSTMRIIRDLEDAPRGVYTGAIGCLGPNRSSRFSVAIRTVSQRPGETMRYGVGSGVVWDSSSEDEWAENALKTAVLNRTSTEFGLFETLHWPLLHDGELLELHLNRISKAAAELGISFEPEAAEALLCKTLSEIAEPTRVKLTLWADGRITVSHLPCGPTPELLTFSIARSPISAYDPLLRIKSTRRKVYERHLQSGSADEVLLWNDRGEISEFCKGNVVVKIGDELVTPPIQSGLLGGVYREWLLRKGEIREQVICLSEISHAAEVFRINGLTGRVPAKLAESELFP